MASKMLYRVPEACDVGGLTRSRLFELLRQGEIESIRLGKQRLISARSLEGWVEAQLAQARAGGAGRGSVG